MERTPKLLFAPWRWNRRSYAAILPLFFAGYVLSEAPLQRLDDQLNPRLCGQADMTVQPRRTFVGSAVQALERKSRFLYGPANWVYDKTPLHGPLRAWAAWWDVDDDFEDGKMWREFDSERNL